MLPQHVVHYHSRILVDLNDYFYNFVFLFVTHYHHEVCLSIENPSLPGELFPSARISSRSLLLLLLLLLLLVVVLLLLMWSA